jgi:hypothetical protein
MKLNWTGWVMVAASMLVAADALAIGGNEPLGDPKNGLSSQSFRRNALTTNTRALEILRTHALNDDLFWGVEGGYIGRQLHDPAARAVAEELVECALKGVTLTFVDRQDSNKEYRWTGQLGLCQPAGTHGWHDAAPTEECQQLVTACVMARVNALGKAIPLSMRGRPASMFPLVERVSTTPLLREGLPGDDPSEGTPIHSFDSTCNPGDDCGWRAAHVGTCSPGARVQLAVEPPPGAGSPRLRVCAGIHGCNKREGSLEPPRPYSRYLGESPLSSGPTSSAGEATRFEFTCPVGPHTGGYYSVMVQQTPGPLLSVRQLTSSGSYPASEQEVFTFLEGAFYGNLFEPHALTTHCEILQGGTQCVRNPGYQGNKYPDELVLPYTNVHACYSFAQQQDDQNGDLGVKYINSRVCAAPDGDCFLDRPRPCTEGPNSARCRWVSSAGGYEGCADPGNPARTFHSITTYLNDPCDLIDERALCDKVTSLHRAKGRGKDRYDFGGCARSWSAAGALVLAAVVVLIALLLRMRRRRASLVGRMG